jgi:hypothetical protein
MHEDSLALTSALTVAVQPVSARPIVREGFLHLTTQQWIRQTCSEVSVHMVGRSQQNLKA